MTDLMTTKELLAILRVSMTTLQRMRRDDGFPAPVRLSPRRIVWRGEDIAGWMAAR
jgi:predicted DNA-binding transcriptional regulator AlpA